MKIDIHYHVLGDGTDINNADNDIYRNFEDNHIWYIRLLHNSIEDELEELGTDFDNNGIITTDEYFDLTYLIFKKSKELDGIVLLAMDAVYSPKTGARDDIKTDLYITNTYLSTMVTKLNEKLLNDPEVENKNKRFYLGASVSPNRLDWEKELNKVFKETDAVLMKWIPSTQHIHLKDKKHKEFYQALVEKNMPLLCHVGPEYSFPEGRRKKKLDNFKNLEYPLHHGVKVIAAHCAMPVFPLINKNQTKKFYKFMKSANSGGEIRLWADTSALSLMTRTLWIEKIVRTFPSDWLVHGSDFPLPFDHWPHQPWFKPEISPDEYKKIKKEKNPLDKDVLIKRAYDFSDTILENTATVLGLSGMN